MKMRETGRYSSLFCGKNKGFILTLDALFAVIIAVIAIAAASTYTSGSYGEPMSRLQMSRTGYDLLDIVTQKGLWASQTDIETELSALLPASYSIILREQCSGGWNDLAKSNAETFDLPDKEIVTGEKVIVKKLAARSINYCRVRFYIWLK